MIKNKEIRKEVIDKTTRLLNAITDLREFLYQENEAILADYLSPAQSQLRRVIKEA